MRPLREELNDPADSAAVERVWGSIEARRRAPSRGRGTLLLAAAAISLLALGVAAKALRPREAPRSAITAARAMAVDEGPLRRQDGSEFAVGFLSASRATVLSDRSRIELGDGARLEALASDARTVVTRLESGRVRFDVTPGGPRRWSIECGPTSVEVVGTAFVLDRSAGRLHVEVEHGVVLVRGERVPDRVRRLGAGQSIDVLEAPAISAVIAAVPARVQRPVVTAQRVEVDAGVVIESVASLFARADALRREGRPTEAAALLESLLARHENDPRAALAAFTLGRVEADSLRRHERAAVAFERAIALRVPGGLMEDAWQRLIDARERSGDDEGARRDAREYLRRFPDGAHADAMRRRAQTQ